MNKKELPRCLCFILVACAPMLADELGVPGEPGHDWSQTAEQSPRGVRLSVARAANTGAPHREETSLKSAVQTAARSYFLNVKNVALFKPTSIKAIPCLFSILLATKKKTHVGSTKQTKKSKLTANSYPVNNNLASIVRGRPEYTH